MKIICATDFSPPGQAAAELAAGLARVLGDSVCLLHVIDPTPMLGLEMGPETGSWENALRETAARELGQEAKRLSGNGLAIETRVEVGSVVDHLRALADEQKARLVVLGSHGRKGAAQFFVGSVAEDMARTSRCPVVVTRGLPFPEQGIFGEQRLHLGVLIDGTPGAEAALAWVKSVFETALKTPPVPGLVPPPVLEAGMKTEIEARLARLIPPEAAARGIASRVVVSEASTAVDGLKQQAERLDADVVVVASHGRGGVKRAVLGSVASDLVTGSTRAVLVLHPAGR